MSEHPINGSCLCGDIIIGIDAWQSDVTYCHCSQCRKQTGLYYAAADVLHTDLHVDESKLAWFDASEEASRAFCPRCGSALFWRKHGSDCTAVMPGCINGDPGLKADGHIFIADRGDYYTLSDGLPQWPQSDT